MHEWGSTAQVRRVWLQEACGEVEIQKPGQLKGIVSLGKEEQGEQGTEEMNRTNITDWALTVGPTLC